MLPLSTSITITTALANSRSSMNNRMNSNKSSLLVLTVLHQKCPARMNHTNAVILRTNVTFQHHRPPQPPTPQRRTVRPLHLRPYSRVSRTDSSGLCRWFCCKYDCGGAMAMKQSHNNIYSFSSSSTTDVTETVNQETPSTATETTTTAAAAAAAAARYESLTRTSNGVDSSTNNNDYSFPKLPTTIPSFTTIKTNPNSSIDNQDTVTAASTTNADGSTTVSSLLHQPPPQQQGTYVGNPKPIMIHLTTTTLQDAITEQKKHAIEVWEGVLRYGTYPDSGGSNTTPTETMPTSISYNDAMYVRQQLQEGYVVPTFHAYTISEEQRLYHPNSLINTGVSTMGGSHTNPHHTPIRITCQSVKAGHCYYDPIINIDDDVHLNGSSGIETATATNVTLSQSRTIMPYTMPNTSTTSTSNINNCSSEHPNDTITSNNNDRDNKRSATISFECDYMTTFIDTTTGLAREHVYDPGYIDDTNGWTFSTKYTNEMVHLINTPAEMIGEDMEVTPLRSNLGINPTQNDCNFSSYGTCMITRRLSRGIVLDCFKNLQRPSRTFAITGNKGIGKSYTLLFALQQALLYDKMCVIFILQKEQKAILCIRNQDQVYAWEGSTIHHMAISSLFTNPNVIVLADPIDAENGGIQYAIGARRMIYAASYHIDHFNKPLPLKVLNRNRGVKWTIPHKERFLSPYTEDELRIALPFMLNVNNTTFDEAMRRTYTVGMIPKYVLNDIDYQKRKKQVDEYIHLLQSDGSEMEQLLKWNGLIEAGEAQPVAAPDSALPTNDDTIFDDKFEVDGVVIAQIVTPKRVSMESPKLKSKSPPKPGTTAFYKMGEPLFNNLDGTMVLSLNALETVDRANPIDSNTTRSSSTRIGYNGHHRVRYTDPKMTITSPKIYDTIIQHYMKTNPSYIVRLWDKVGSGYHNGMHDCIADLFWDFVVQQRMKVDRYRPNKNFIAMDTKAQHLTIMAMNMERRKLLHPWKSFKLNRGKDNINPMSEWVVSRKLKGNRVILDRDGRYTLNDLKNIFRMRKKGAPPKMVRMETKTQNTIHFAGPGRVVYQIVNDDDYGINYDVMVKVLVYGKYLEWQQKVSKHHGTIACSTNPPVQKLDWYFVVPNTRSAMKWEQRGPSYYEVEPQQNESTEQRNARRILNRHKEEVNTCINLNVVQHVLVMNLDHYTDLYNTSKVNVITEDTRNDDNNNNDNNDPNTDDSDDTTSATTNNADDDSGEENDATNTTNEDNQHG